jgi:hypothetical protein
MALQRAIDSVSTPMQPAHEPNFLRAAPNRRLLTSTDRTFKAPDAPNHGPSSPTESHCSPSKAAHDLPVRSSGRAMPSRARDSPGAEPPARPSRRASTRLHPCRTGSASGAVVCVCSLPRRAPCLDTPALEFAVCAALSVSCTLILNICFFLISLVSLFLSLLLLLLQQKGRRAAP